MYDLEADPQEVRNLAGERDYEGKPKEMVHDVEKWQLRTKDKWLYRDGQSIVAMERYAGEDLQF